MRHELPDFRAFASHGTDDSGGVLLVRSSVIEGVALDVVVFGEGRCVGAQWPMRLADAGQERGSGRSPYRIIVCRMRHSPSHPIDGWGLVDGDFNTLSDSPDPRSTPSIPGWVAEYPSYADAVDEAARDIPDSSDSFESLSGVKAAMHIAARRVRRLEADGEPSYQAALLQRLLRAMVALRAHRVEEGRRVVRWVVDALGCDVGWLSVAAAREGPTPQRGI